MTPKEKAKELIEKFNVNASVYYMEDSVPCIKTAPMINMQVKKFALLCVDEILSSDLEAKRGSLLVIEIHNIEDYWEQVKQEIETL